MWLTVCIVCRRHLSCYPSVLTIFAMPSLCVLFVWGFEDVSLAALTPTVTAALVYRGPVLFSRGLLGFRILLGASLHKTCVEG